MSYYDAIIIGSGLGGLTCGATLSKKGKKVLVLEQHSLIGGCSTCFERKGMLVDAGLHELDFGNRRVDQKYRIFDFIGLWEKVEFIKLPSAWTIKIGNKDYLIPHSNTAQALKEMFPHEAKGIDEYFKKIRLQARKAYKFPFDMGFFEFFLAPITTIPYFIYNFLTNRTVGTILDKCIKDSDLKRILNINIVYYHHDAYKFIWSYHAIAQNNYYIQGTYVKGGSQALSDGIASIIVDHGGEVRSKADVTDILLDGNKAIGVRYFDKKSKKSVEVYAKSIVANCDPALVYNKLLPQERDYSKDTNLTKDFEITTSLISVYMVFDKNLSELYPNMDYSTFIVNPKNFNKDFKYTDCYNTSYEEIDFVFVNYSKIDSGLSKQENRYLGVITTFGKYEDWDGLSKEAYKAKKEEVKKILEDRLQEAFPEIMTHCIHSELATPKTIERYIKTRKGTPYGYDQNRETFFGRERWKSYSIKNLYFASAFCNPGGGFTGAIMSGYRTGRKILDPYALPRKFLFSILFGVILSQAIQLMIKALV
ncbi:NAD(P)/FAD-dependent oxidoreductase [Helicobacter cholecystus]|uniref:NAD(P)/FAD-dependent oxidoreductase n=1 Tax=Helicobacter cholecystus TaxID=45498 RepID=A0A3D8IY78_9HELI|nr:NAD(P)/FAD-dependent oxidoreductase [Helicobacter cholecystus]RDU69574.1 NAD(P)/FAD-dependent oxidoreductase [Helicobacter cholecystus]VEJ24131.1 Diapolycopene oxygenase [Helicobacter cholecystus]